MQCPTCGQPLTPPFKMKLDLKTGCVIVGEWIARVPPRQAELLFVLLENMPEPVPIIRLIQRMYGALEPQEPEMCVRSYIRHLKKSLKGSGYEVKNRYGFGYSLRPLGKP